MPQVTRSWRGRWQLWVHIIASLLLATAPIWIRDIIVAGYELDDPGSAVDVFVWFGWVTAAAILYLAIQVGVLALGRFASLTIKALVILSSALLWAASMAWLHHVKIP